MPLASRHHRCYGFRRVALSGKQPAFGSTVECEIKYEFSYKILSLRYPAPRANAVLPAVALRTVIYMPHARNAGDHGYAVADVPPFVMAGRAVWADVGMF